jgi:hypothetical protein
MEQVHFEKLISNVKRWMVQMLAAHADRMEPVASAGFDILKQYYPQALLERIHRVVVDRCPVPPLAVFGIPQLAEIENWDLKGIPWDHTVFIRRDLADWDAVHFHEVLHSVQWQYLGTERYLTAWAIGTIAYGYRDNPLEEMAFRLQARFESDTTPFDVVREVNAELARLPDDLFDFSRIV